MDEPKSASAIEIVVEYLADHPEIQFEQTERELRVPGKQGGFPAYVSEVGGEQIVGGGGGWHTHFEDAQQAADLFMWLLTPRTRLVEKWRRKSLASARLERFEGGEWVRLNTFAPLFQLFFLPTETVILQNSHIVHDRSDGAADQ